MPQNTPQAVILALLLPILVMPGMGRTADIERFLEYPAWNCTLEISLDRTDESLNTPFGVRQKGPQDRRRDHYQEHIKARIHVHDVQDMGDGIRLAAWKEGTGTGTAHLRHESRYTEFKGLQIEDRTVQYDGPVSIYGEDYEPGFLVWIDRDRRTYGIQWGFDQVPAHVVSHCRMQGENEEGRKRLEHATDADMPMGSFFSALTRTACATESKGTIKTSGRTFGGSVVDLPIPDEPAFRGEAETTDSHGRKGVKVRWECVPE